MSVRRGGIEMSTNENELIQGVFRHVIAKARRPEGRLDVINPMQGWGPSLLLVESLYFNFV